MQMSSFGSMKKLWELPSTRIKHLLIQVFLDTMLSKLEYSYSSRHLQVQSSPLLGHLIKKNESTRGSPEYGNFCTKCNHQCSEQATKY